MSVWASWLLIKPCTCAPPAVTKHQKWISGPLLSSQIVQQDCLRSGLWGAKRLWGRILTCKG